METKSRYAVISDLEQEKRTLILEKDGLNDQLVAKQKLLTLKERSKADTILVIDREIVDIKLDITNFETTMKDRKETIVELIKSVDVSLTRLGSMSK